MFLAAIKAGLYGLAVIGVLTSVISAYYYLMIVKVMYFDVENQVLPTMPPEPRFVLGTTGLFNLPSSFIQHR